MFASAPPASINVTLEPAPIPADWVISGAPQAREFELAHSPDGTCTFPQWDCTAGTFHWYFGIEETIHILEGEVLVRDAAGVRRTRLLQPPEGGGSCEPSSSSCCNKYSR